MAKWSENCEQTNWPNYDHADGLAHTRWQAGGSLRGRQEGQGETMRIAQIAPLQVAVPPTDYGGTERVIYNLTEALVQLGHDVTLFATGDSHTSARLVPGLPKAIRFDPAVDASAAHLAHLAEIYRQADQFDVIHSHLDYYTLPFTRMVETPTVITLHGRLDNPEFIRIFSHYHEANYISISKSQRSQVPHINWIATVHHAIDLDRVKFFPDHGEYLAFVGRIAPEKGPDRAIEIAKRAGIPLVIAAKVDPKDLEYFETVVRPMMKHPLIEFIGPVGEERKQELMGHALALLTPIDWPEPFGMVFIESLACGTPVLTCPCGSVPEILEDGVTGYMASTVDELVEAVSKVRYLNRERCRAYVRKKFDISKMAMAYVKAYLTQVQLREMREKARSGGYLKPLPGFPLDLQWDEQNPVPALP
jgi:glycosyltransferase involved in cell wall biosynthesis